MSEIIKINDLNKSVKELTIGQLKELIREVLSEEFLKHDFVKTVPIQPYYYEVPNPSKSVYEVWCDTKTIISD